MTRFTPTGPAQRALRAGFARARTILATAGERGASAVEWVVISAIVVALAIAIGATLTTALGDKAKEVGTEIGTSGGTP